VDSKRQNFDGSAGDIFVIKAGEIHSFKAVGDSHTDTIRRSPQSRSSKRTFKAVACTVSCTQTEVT